MEQLYIVTRNSPGDEIANVNFFTTTSHTYFKKTKVHTGFSSLATFKRSIGLLVTDFSSFLKRFKLLHCMSFSRFVSQFLSFFILIFGVFVQYILRSSG